jgi:UDP-N-acetylmuramate--alanine ligase
MPQEIEPQTTKIPAAHRYEVVRPRLDVSESLAGKKLHFIGAGGIGMSGLAKVLLGNEAVVSGSDMTESETIEKLRKLGADIKTGHSADYINEGLDAVVISAAVKENNPELQKARSTGLKVYKYAEMLGELMNRYDGIAVAGTHGKSTTSGWLSFVMSRAGITPNFIVGADVTQLGSNSGTGKGKWFIAEACEYDRSFLNLRPKIAAILNIEQDHLDYYKNEDDIIDAFVDFAGRVRRDGTLIVNIDDKNVLSIFRKFPQNIRRRTFGLIGYCQYQGRHLAIEDGCYAFDVYFHDMFLGRVRISLPGIHNVHNALAVIACAMQAGIEYKKILEILPQFKGIDRRLMLKGQLDGITVLDDYAHHPTEIRASLEAIRQRYNPKRLWCVFQPHQYSRTRFLLDDFAESFNLADVTIVPQIYFVRDSELTKELVDAQKLVDRICRTGSKAYFIDGFEAICEYLKENVNSGELVVTMGAGDIWKVADEYLQRLGTDS